MADILLVEDEPELAFAVERVLTRLGHAVHAARTLQDARTQLADHPHLDMALVDLGLPDGDALEWLSEVAPRMPFVVVTGHDDARSAVAALRAGAQEYVVKPVPMEQLQRVVQRTLQLDQLQREVELARRGNRGGQVEALGVSAAWARVMDQVARVAAAPRTPVFISGETGTGKEVVARLIHAQSPRRDRPFVTVNAACFTEQLMESELFGHEAGAFTDAKHARKGVFELADGGTLFLDELAELSPGVQARLLRVLEGHPFRRVGGEREVRTDVRVLTATHKDMEAAVARGAFRQDLYHRLRVYSLELPPLRTRPDDIGVLARHFLSRVGPEMGIRETSLTDAAERALMQHTWPGNVRELRNCMERALVNSPTGVVDVRHLGLQPPAVTPRQGIALGITNTLDAAIKHVVLRAFHANGGNISKTARQLDVSRNALKRRLASYGVRPQDEDDADA